MQRGTGESELEGGVLVERHRFPQIKESFYAITPSRRFSDLILRELMRSKGRRGDETER
jgi:LysR family transcriptional activator of nhaA